MLHVAMQIIQYIGNNQGNWAKVFMTNCPEYVYMPDVQEKRSGEAKIGGTKK